MVEWGRLLSGYWGEILSRRFESCPPRHSQDASYTGAFFVPSQAPIEGMLFESCPPRHDQDASCKGAFLFRRIRMNVEG